MLKIAICDDEQPIREYLKKLVEKCTEAEVSLFADGEELLADPPIWKLLRLISIISSGKIITESLAK